MDVSSNFQVIENYSQRRRELDGSLAERATSRLQGCRSAAIDVRPPLTHPGWMTVLHPQFDALKAAFRAVKVHNYRYEDVTILMKSMVDARDLPRFIRDGGRERGIELTDDEINDITDGSFTPTWNDEQDLSRSMLEWDQVEALSEIGLSISPNRREGLSSTIDQGVYSPAQVHLQLIDGDKFVSFLEQMVTSNSVDVDLTQIVEQVCHDVHSEALKEICDGDIRVVGQSIVYAGSLAMRLGQLGMGSSSAARDLRHLSLQTKPGAPEAYAIAYSIGLLAPDTSRVAADARDRWTAEDVRRPWDTAVEAVQRTADAHGTESPFARLLYDNLAEHLAVARTAWGEQGARFLAEYGHNETNEGYVREVDLAYELVTDRVNALGSGLGYDTTGLEGPPERRM